MKFYTYELRDPRTHIPFYVGKGSGDRIHIHENSVKNWTTVPMKTHNPHLFNKIKKLLAEGVSVEAVKVFETSSEQEAFEKERELISLYRLQGIKLCNILDGGEGAVGHRFSHSEETKRKMSESSKGKLKTKEHRESLRMAKLKKPTKYWKGKSFSEDHRKRLSDTKKAFYATPEGREVIQARVAKNTAALRKTVEYKGEVFTGTWKEVYVYFGFSRFLRKGLLASGALKILEKD